MSLLDTLKTLDPLDDTLWTDDGLPAIDAVKALTADRKLTREAINKVALGLTRTNVAEYTVPPEAATVVEDVVAVAVVETTVALSEVEVLFAKIEEMQKVIATKTEAKRAIESEIDALARELAALEITIPYREIQLENQRKGLEALMARSDAEGRERAAKVNKLKELGLTPEQLIDLLPNDLLPDSAKLRYDRII